MDDEIEGGGVRTLLVPAHDALCLRQRGPVDSPGAVFREVFDAAGQESIDLTTDPPYAVVFLQERAELEPVEADHEVEVRVPIMMPGWAGQLAAGLERVAGSGVRRRVEGGSPCPAATAAPGEWAAWAGEVLERLDAAVPDSGLRRAVVRAAPTASPTGASTRCGPATGSSAASTRCWWRCASTTTVQGQSWYESPVRVGDTIYVTKDPVDQEGWKAAPDDGDAAGRLLPLQPGGPRPARRV